MDKFRFSKQKFEDLKLENNHLLLANFSLPFCDKDEFRKLWKKIDESICEGGYFVGNFFGINDEWRKTKERMTFLTKKQVIGLFKDFKIIEFKEFEKDGITCIGKLKHWHIFNVIAKKKELNKQSASSEINKNYRRKIMQKRMNKKELINLIESLKIDKDEYWILSSGALVIRGVYPDAGDLDIAVTEKGLEELKSNYNLKEKENGWYIVNDKVECVLETKETWKIEKFGKYNLQSIEKYYDFLKKSNRKKDKERIPLIEEYMKKK